MVHENRQSRGRGSIYTALLLAGTGCTTAQRAEITDAWRESAIAQVEESERREGSLNSERPADRVEPTEARPEYRAVSGRILAIEYEIKGKRILKAQERGELTEEQAAERLQALDAKYKWETLKEVKEAGDKWNEYNKLADKLDEEHGYNDLSETLRKKLSVDSEGNVVLEPEEGKEYRSSRADSIFISYRTEGRSIMRALEDGEISEEQATERLGALDAKYKWNEVLSGVSQAWDKVEKLHELRSQLREQYQVSALATTLYREFNVDAEGNVVGPVAQVEGASEQPAQEAPANPAEPAPEQPAPEAPAQPEVQGEPAQPAEGAQPTTPEQPPVRPPLEPPVLPSRGMSIDDVAPPTPRESQWNKFWNGAGEVLDINGHLLGIVDYTLGQADRVRDGNRSHLREAYRKQPLQWRVAGNTPWYLWGEREFERWAVRENKIGSSKGLWGFSDKGRASVPSAQPAPSQFSNSDPTSDPNNQVTIPNPTDPQGPPVSGPQFGRGSGN